MEEQIIDALRGELKRQADASDRGLKVSEEEPGVIAIAGRVDVDALAMAIAGALAGGP